MLPTSERYIRDAFFTSVILKGIGAFFELVFGIALLFTNDVASLVLTLARNELVEDPTSFLASHVSVLVSHLPQSSFWSYYLLSHAIIKIFLVWGLLRDRGWAYPASFVFLATLIGYQVYECILSFSWPLALLTLFDSLLLWLVYHEYRFFHRRLDFKR